MSFRILCFLVSALLLPLPGRLTAAVQPGLPSITVPEGFMVTEAVKPGLIAYPMFGAFDHDGRLYIAESSGKDVRGAAMAANPECRIRLLEDTDGDGVFDSSTVFADRIGIPMGVLHHKGAVYVASPPDFLKFTDEDNDGIADRREVLLTGWNVRGTASLHGPFLGPDGWMYLTDGRHGYDITTPEGKHLKGLASRIWKCRPNGTGLDWFAGGGFDNPVELVFTPAGEMIGTMTYFTNPQLGQRDALMHFIRGGVYSKDHPSVSEFKRTGDLLGPLTRFARVAPAGLLRYEGSSFGPEYQGNLFSAHFNPHRVMRHVLTATNATFISEDSDFLVSSHPDFHPTDLVEDADGSLIVIDTGGWYVDQCPLSRVSKPEFRGSLYRVSRIGARPLRDPRGKSLRLSNASTAARALLDPRPVVRARARDFLSDPKTHGADSALARLLSTAEDSRARCDAVWLLHRIGSRAARAAIRRALSDPDEQVRIAAVQSIGLARDQEADLDRLHRLLAEGGPAERRAVASTLGQLGNTRSNGPLIQAAATATNRFEEHAIIFSLIENYSRMTNSNIKHSAPQLARLAPRSARAALIAFDQMDHSQLRQEHVLPLLDHPSPIVQAAAAEVFTRHPDWAEAALTHLQAKLVEYHLEEHELSGLQTLMRTFASEPKVQELMAEAFMDATLAFPRRKAIIEVIHDADLATFPGKWLNPVRKALASTNEVMKQIAFDIVESRNLPGFDEYLHRIAESDPSDTLRARALGVLARQDALTDTQIERLFEDARSNDPRRRLAAVGVLSRAHLSEDQLLELALEVLPKADGLVISPLLSAFRASKSDRVGKAFIDTLTKNPALWEITNPRAVEQALVNYSDKVRQAGDELLRQLVQAHQDRIERLTKLAPLLRGGSVTAGRRVFFSQKAQCSACHAIGHEGGNLGPDLTAIGKIRSGLDILEAIVFPSASFVPGYEPMKVVTKDDLYSGNIVAETKDTVTLKINANTEIQLKRTDIKAIRPGDVSVMPAGLDQVLTRKELADLLAFLQSLNGEQWLQPDRLGAARKPALSPAERAARQDGARQ